MDGPADQNEPPSGLVNLPTKLAGIITRQAGPQVEGDGWGAVG